MMTTTMSPATGRDCSQDLSRRSTYSHPSLSNMARRR